MNMKKLAIAILILFAVSTAWASMGGLQGGAPAGPRGVQGDRGPSGNPGSDGASTYVFWAADTNGTSCSSTTVNDYIQILTSTTSKTCSDTQTGSTYWKKVVGPAGADSTIPGPQGPQGEQGAQGIQGLQGSQGPAGTSDKGGCAATPPTNGTGYSSGDFCYGSDGYGYTWNGSSFDKASTQTYVAGMTSAGIVKQTGTGSSASLEPATGSDIVGLFGTCTGTQYLGADHACHDMSALPSGCTGTPTWVDHTTYISLDCVPLALTLTSAPTSWSPTCIEGDAAQTQDIVFTANNGSVTLGSSAAALTTGTVFSITSDTCSSQTITSGNDCTVSLSMGCSTAGTPTDTLTVTSDASDSPKEVALSGTVSAASSSVDIALNFRSTSGFVTDVSPETYVLATDTDPTTRGGFTFGWEGSIYGGNDENYGFDRRLAGSHIVGNTSPSTFKITLPETGTYNIELAAGTSIVSAVNVLVLKDGGSTFKSISNNPAVDNYSDANGSTWSRAAWLTSNVSIQHTFTSTTFEIAIGDGASSGYSAINHVRVWK